jgi:hypothetical protein
MDKKTRKDLEAECLAMFEKVGDCWSVRGKHPELWDWFSELISLHPYYPENVLGFHDVRLSGGDMMLAYFDEDVPFSWKMCCIRPKRYYRREAMRYAVSEQIETFRKNAELVCPCGSAGPYHVDHVIFFADLCRQFEKDRTDVPDDTARTYGTNKWFQACFRGGKFAADWVEFHRANAVLRILCKNCNLGREKPRRA